jgi:hypothetical protein
LSTPERPYNTSTTTANRANSLKPIMLLLLSVDFTGQGIGGL